MKEPGSALRCRAPSIAVAKLMELEAHDAAPLASQAEELKTEETPWVLEPVLCDLAGRCSKLGPPQPVSGSNIAASEELQAKRCGHVSFILSPGKRLL